MKWCILVLYAVTCYHSLVTPNFPELHNIHSLSLSYKLSIEAFHYEPKHSFKTKHGNNMVRTQDIGL